MVLGKGGRVNIIITNRVLRYLYQKSTSLDSLENYGEVELPAGTIEDGTIKNKSALLEIVNQLVQKNKWKRKKLFFCVPDDTVVIRQIDIPAPLAKNEIKGYINTQIGNRIYLPFDDPAIDFELLEKDPESDQQSILLFAYPKDKLNDFKTVFAEAGLKPAAADLTSLSVYRYYYLLEKNKEDDILLVHWNVESLITTAFNKHKAVFTRYRKLDTSPKLGEIEVQQIIEEQTSEVNRIIDFYQYNITNGSRIKKLLVSGDFPYLMQVKDEFLAKVTVPVSFVDETNKSSDTYNKYTDVLGLAMKQEG